MKTAAGVLRFLCGRTDVISNLVSAINAVSALVDFRLSDMFLWD